MPFNLSPPVQKTASAMDPVTFQLLSPWNIWRSPACEKWATPSLSSTLLLPQVLGYDLLCVSSYIHTYIFSQYFSVPFKGFSPHRSLFSSILNKHFHSHVSVNIFYWWFQKIYIRSPDLSWSYQCLSHHLAQINHILTLPPGKLTLFMFLNFL